MSIAQTKQDQAIWKGLFCSGFCSGRTPTQAETAKAAACYDQHTLVVDCADKDALLMLDLARERARHSRRMRALRLGK